MRKRTGFEKKKLIRRPSSWPTSFMALEKMKATVNLSLLFTKECLTLTNRRTSFLVRGKCVAPEIPVVRPPNALLCIWSSRVTLTSKAPDGARSPSSPARRSCLQTKKRFTLSHLAQCTLWWHLRNSQFTLCVHIKMRVVCSVNAFRVASAF